MDKQKQIEEMAQDIEKLIVIGWSKELYIGSAESLYNAGYRKIPEDAVVLTKFEYEGLKARIDAAESKNKTISYVVDNTQKETARSILRVINSKLDLYKHGVIGGSLYDEGYKSAVKEIMFMIQKLYGQEE